MIVDGHIHMRENVGGDFRERFAQAGCGAAMVLSPAPASFHYLSEPLSNAERLERVLSVAGEAGDVFPFYWIDPLEDDAAEQVDEAARQGVDGFKVICNRFDPGEPRALEVYRAIARRGKPLLFHSGILWDGAPSSRHSRPVLFEALLEVEGLRFALAHVGWPWTDETIAVFGKFADALRRRPSLSAEMYIDLTPGTPPIYRREVLTRLLTVGYDVRARLLFGSDCDAGDYDVGWARDWIERDREIYNEMGLTDARQEDIFATNFLRFIGRTGSGRS